MWRCVDDSCRAHNVDGVEECEACGQARRDAPKPAPIAAPAAYREVPDRARPVEGGVCSCGKTVDEHRAEFRHHLATLADRIGVPHTPLVETKAPVVGYREPADVERLERRRVEMLDAYARYLAARR